MDTILIIGKPNSGKTLLFNRLTGLRQNVANFPGVTVEVKKGTFQGLEVLDFPGIYSIDPLTLDEEIAVDKFRESLATDKTKLVVCVLDATRIERSLIFGLQAIEEAKKYNKGLILVMNMIDEISEGHTTFDIKGLEKELEHTILPISSKTGAGIEHLKERIKSLARHPTACLPTVPTRDREEIINYARMLGNKYGANSQLLLKEQNKLDHFFLHNVIGGIAFLCIMAFLFQSIFTWSTPLMDLTESVIMKLGQLTMVFTSEGLLKDFIEEAIFSGLGAFLVFVPQIMVLTFIVGLLEDSGLLARATLIVHRPLSYFGLTGKSFVPYLSGLACAIPAIMAARTIESPRKRMITIMTIPLVPCSARLPVYALLITALIPAIPFFGGLMTLQGLAFLGLFLFGIFMALAVSIILNKFSSVKNKNDVPFMIELPPYRWPHCPSLFIKSVNSAKSFVVNAGGIIFCLSLIVWVLGRLPLGTTDLEHSWLASLGKLIGPLFEPLGLDWRYSVAILASFLAREVFVGTLGTLFGMEGGDENIINLSSQIKSDGLELSSALALLVFYTIALQCVSTLAVMKKELGNIRGPMAVFISYSILAYLMALIVKWTVSALYL